MSISQSIRNTTARDESLTAALGRVADAMERANIAQRRSTRLTDREGQLISTEITAPPEATSAGGKFSAREPETDKRSAALVYTFWTGTDYTLNPTPSQERITREFIVEAGERLVFRWGRTSSETSSSSVWRFVRLGNGESVSYSVNELDYTYYGAPGESYEVTLVNNDSVGNTAGQVTAVYSPVANETGTLSPFDGDGVLEDIPSAIFDFVPRLLPAATYNTVGGLVKQTTISLNFHKGLAPYLPISGNHVNDVLLSFVYAGGFGWDLMPGGIPLNPLVVVRRWNTGDGTYTTLALENWRVFHLPNSVTPKFIAYANIDHDTNPLLRTSPVRVEIRFEHSGAVEFFNIGTLGYYTVRGR